MARKVDLSGTTLPRRQLGRALRDARQGANLTLDQVGRDPEAEMSRSTLSRIELGQYDKVRVRDVAYLCQYYGLPEARTAYLCSIAKEANTKVWWQDDRHLMSSGFITYLELESFASEFRFYQSLLVPGLLQTVDYATTLERSYTPDDTQEEIEARVAIRRRRADLLTRRHRSVAVEFLLHESIFHTLVGTPKVMADQCLRIADMSTLGNVTVGVVPCSAGHPTGGALPPYIIMDFPDSEPTVVYTEGAIGSMIFEDGNDVKRFTDIHETLQRAALKEQPSRDLLRKIAGRYQR